MSFERPFGHQPAVQYHCEGCGQSWVGDFGDGQVHECPTPSPEQPEHEEARRLAIEAGWRVVRMPVVGYLVECPTCGFEFNEEHEDEDGGWSCPVCAEIELRALLSKAEQERDKKQRLLEMEREENERYFKLNNELREKWHQAEQERDAYVRGDGQFEVALRDAERELERLREALDLIEAEPEDPAKVQKIARDALSADTQREDG